MAPKHDLSDSDLARLEELSKNQEHRTWLWALIRRTLVWIGAIGVAVNYTYQGIVQLLAWLRGHP